MSYARMARIKPLKTREQIVFYPFLLYVSSFWELYSVYSMNIASPNEKKR